MLCYILEPTVLYMIPHQTTERSSVVTSQAISYKTISIYCIHSAAVSDWPTTGYSRVLFEGLESHSTYWHHQQQPTAPLLVRTYSFLRVPQCEPPKLDSSFRAVLVSPRPPVLHSERCHGLTDRNIASGRNFDCDNKSPLLALEFLKSSTNLKIFCVVFFDN